MTFQEELINNSYAIHLRMVMDENKKFRLQLKAVRELHKISDNGLVCLHCLDYENKDSDYPCPTIKALDGDT